MGTECYEVSRLTTCDRPAPSRSSYSADDCFYVETISPFPGSNFMKEGSIFMKVRRLKLIEIIV